MNQLLQQSLSRWTQIFWADDLRELKGTRLFIIKLVRLIIVMSRQLFGGQLSLRAMSLVYTTLLSFVPLLAVSFSVLKGFGVHNQIEPLLLRFLAPLGPQGSEIAARVLGFVENIKVGVLGSLGLLFLLYTVVSLTQKVEASFNYIWQVAHLRSFAQRFSSYLSVILIGPVLVFAALGVTASVTSNTLVQQLVSIEPFGRLFLIIGKLIPYLLVTAAFTFLYIFIPNTRVHWRAALIGGLVAGVLWETSGWAFAAFIANSSKYAAIYSGFAILILLLIWLYLSWLILLLGAQVAFYLQYPQYLTRHPVHLELSNRLRERLALHLMVLIAERHLHKGDPWTLEALVEHIGLPVQPIHKVLRLLLDSGFLSETGDDPPAYLPRRDIETITLWELFSVVRRAGESRFLSSKRMPHLKSVDTTLDAVQSMVKKTLGDRTLKDLVLESQRLNATPSAQAD